MIYKLRIWPEFLFPAPWAVVETLIKGFGDQTLIWALLSSFKRLLVGYCIALFLGITLGILVAKVKLVEETFGFLVLGLQTVPSVVWLPLALLWFGIGDGAIIFVVALGATWTMILSTHSGVKNIQPLLLRAARTMGARGIVLFWHVILPAIVPSIITGMRLAWAFSWRALIAGELVGSGAGLGQVLMLGRSLGDMGLVLSVMLIIAALGIILDNVVFRRIEQDVLLKWGLVTN